LGEQILAFLMANKIRRKADMTRRIAMPGIAILVGVSWLWLAGAVSAAQSQFSFNDGARYKAEVDASSPATIPPGTQITTANWTQYQGFLPVGIQALYSDQYGFKVGDGPDFAINVGPTVSTPLPKEMLTNAEKYGHQARLVPLPSGGYGIEGYVAGMPFVNPTEPDLGTKMMYDLWYDYWPFLISYHSHFFIEDRYGNSTPEESIATTWQLMHLSDSPYPIDLPYANGIYHSTRDLLLIPEQSKYTTALDLQPDNPSEVQESYVFLPSLRRPLRLSSAARCSPILGTDWAQDDNAGGIAFQVGLFRAVFLGEKKVLAIVHADIEAGTGSRDNLDKVLHTGLPVPGWPRAAMGKWEVRDAYVIDVQPISKDYCYPHKVFYVDKENWNALEYETYDKSDKLWKVNKNSLGLVNLNNGERIVVSAATEAAIWDLQNTHTSVSTIGTVPEVDKDSSAELQDAQTYAFPGGLSRIMR
jgi:Protein of unknown function (DUF1329)